MKTILFPFGEQLTYRTSAEKINDEVYRTIPALNRMAGAVLTLTNKLTHDARDALLRQDGLVDPSIRLARVEVGLRKRHEAENAQPELEWLMAATPVVRKEYQAEESRPDMWMSPSEN